MNNTKIMKIKICSFLLFFAIGNSNAQILEPVKWKTKVEKISDSEFNLILKGTIDFGWHVYSQFTPVGGSLPMFLEFENIKGNYELIGKAKESPYLKHFVDVFGVEEYYFENSVLITQRIKIINPKTKKIGLHFE